MRSLIRVSLAGLIAGGLVLAAGAPPAAAGPFTRLQVLLPGESAAPGTASGKLGTPQAQTVGVPFSCLVRACDDEWQTVTEVTDEVRLGASDESATLPGDATLTAGEVSLTVTLNAAGSFTLTAEDLSDATIPTAVSSLLAVQVIQGFVFDAINQKNQYAGEPMQIGISAVDPGGEVVSGFSGAVSLQQLTSYGPGRIEPAEIVLADGVWSGPVTLYRADESSINRGNVNIYAVLPGQPEKNGTSDPFTVHPGALARLQLVVPGQDPLPGSVSGLSGAPATQGAGLDFLVDVYATDPYWNPIPCAHDVRIVSSDPAATTPVSGTLVDGHVSLTLALGSAGSQTLTVTDLTDGAVLDMTTAPIAVIPSAVHHFVIEDLPPVIAAGTPVAVSIRATDSAGNTLPDYDGDAFLSANTGAGTISPEAATFSDGTWNGEMVFRGAGGAVSFSCSDYASPPHTGTSNSFVVEAGPYVALQVLAPGEVPQGGSATGLTGSPDDQAAGSGFSIRVRAVDEFFNRVSGIASRLDLTSSDPNLARPDELALVNGEAIVPVTLFRAGPQTVSAADADSAGIAAATSSPIEVVAGAYERLLILAPGETAAPGSETGRAGEAIDQSISFAFTVTVHATDAWWNPVAGVTDVVSLTTTDPLAELPPDTPLADGSADLVVRLATGGYQQITATCVSQPTVPASTTQVRAISSGLHLEAEVAPTTVQAGEAFTLTVKVTNDAGAVIQEINTEIDVEVQNAATQEPGIGTLQTSHFQLLQGERTVPETYTGAETIVLIVRDLAGNQPAVTEPITVLPGPPAAIELAAEPVWVRANRHATVTARVVDAHGNGVPDQPVYFSLVSGDGVLTPVDAVTQADGDATADFLGPRTRGVSVVRAEAAALAAELEIETALVDPNAAGGTLTNYPNPFHPDEGPTTIAYVLKDDARVRLRIYTLSGGLVLERTFPRGAGGGTAGLNEIPWNGRNGAGEAVASGGYILHVQAEGEGATMHVMRRKIGVVW